MTRKRHGSVVTSVATAVLLALALPVSAREEPTRPPGPPPDPEPARAVTVILVRHAEKSRDHPRDPGLTDAGRRRAEALADLLASVEVTHLFATEYRRTRDTLAPLAARAELPITVIPASYQDILVATLLDLPPGSTAVVAGHSDTIPGIARALGGAMSGTRRGRSGEAIDESEYDRLVIVIRPPKGIPGVWLPVKTLELRYGP